MALTCSLSPYTHTPSELARSLARAPLPKNSRVRSRDSTPGVFYSQGKVWARGGRGRGRGAWAGVGGAALSRPPAVVKGELGGGARTSAEVVKTPASPVETARACWLDVLWPLPGMQGPWALRERTRTVGQEIQPGASPLPPPPSPPLLPTLLPAPQVLTALSWPLLVATYTLGTPLLATACSELWNLSPRVSNSWPPKASCPS